MNAHEITAPIPRISLTPDEAAASTGFSRTRIFGAIAAGKLVARGDGKATVIETTELARWVHSLPTKPARNLKVTRLTRDGETQFDISLNTP